MFHGRDVVKMGVFTAADGTVDDSAKFCIFKCPVRTKSSGSLAPFHDTEPGTAKDVDFFISMIASMHDRRTLPPSVWNIYEKRDSAKGDGRR